MGICLAILKFFHRSLWQKSSPHVVILELLSCSLETSARLTRTSLSTRKKPAIVLANLVLGSERLLLLRAKAELCPQFRLVMT